MNSFVTVDQGAAIILMSEEISKKYKQNSKQTVYFLGGGYAEDRQRFMIEKSDFTSSPPLKAAVGKALARSRMPLENLDCFDLYSCFPCAVSIAKKMIGIADDDPRPLTLTGGLGFFGGPGNNYSLHGVATLAEKISIGEKSNGLITALGWFMHKHAAGVYGSKPPKGEIKNHDIKDQADCITGNEPVRIQDQVNGPGTIETYTVIYTAEHEPSYVVLYGRTRDNFRFIARMQSHPDIFRLFTSENMVGRKVNIGFNSSENINIAKKMIGIADDDPRPLTLTGGLGFFGGPGNNYSLHGVATLAEKISIGEKSNGLITALGWFMHKHAAGVYGSKPPKGEIKNHDIKDQADCITGNEPVRIQDQVNGPGTIETYTVIYTAEHEPSYVVLYGRTRDNFRFIARMQSHPDIFRLFTSENMVGRKVNIGFNSSENINIADIV